MVTTSPHSATLPAPARARTGRSAPPPRDAHRAEGVTGDAEQADLPARAAALLPPQLLQPSEIIVLLLKPSPWFIVLAPLQTLATLAVLTALAAWTAPMLDMGLGQRDAVLVGGTLIGLRLFWQFLEWLSRVYVLTDQRVIRVQGVLTVQVFEAPLSRVQNTSMLFTVRERVFGLGTIGFATAGTGAFEAYWTMISEPLETHRTVVQTIRRYRR